MPQVLLRFVIPFLYNHVRATNRSLNVLKSGSSHYTWLTLSFSRFASIGGRQEGEARLTEVMEG